MLIPGGSNVTNFVQGNLIGTQLNGTVALANALNGVQIVHSSGNTIGGTTAGSGNTIALNARTVSQCRDGCLRLEQRHLEEFDLLQRRPGDRSERQRPDPQRRGRSEFRPESSAELPDVHERRAERPQPGYHLLGAVVDDELGLPAAGRVLHRRRNQPGRQDDPGSGQLHLPGAKLATISAGAAVVGTKIVATATDANTSEFSLFATVA